FVSRTARGTPCLSAARRRESALNMNSKLEAEMPCAPLDGYRIPSRRLPVEGASAPAECRVRLPSADLFSLYLAAKKNERIPQRLKQFLKFCIVGTSGLIVDMSVLALLTTPSLVGLGVTPGKVCAAETALINNFIWNELWTFKRREAFVASTG